MAMGMSQAIDSEPIRPNAPATPRAMKPGPSSTATTVN